MAFSTTAQFKPDSFGAAFFTTETSKIVGLRIVFPGEMLTGVVFPDSPQLALTSVPYRGTITLFDENGIITELTGRHDFVLVDWCDGDGGTQYRPEIIVSIPKSRLKRPVKQLKAQGGFVCFASAELSRNPGKVSPAREDRVATGDVDHDGQPECLLISYPDQSQNCSGSRTNQLTIDLCVTDRCYALRCCGS